MASPKGKALTGISRATIKPSRQAGFSLVEVLIVMALLALIVGIVAPGINSAFRVSAESFARQTALLLREARDRAMLLDKLIRLRIDLEKQELWLEEAAGGYLLRRDSADRPGLSSREREEAEKSESEAFVMVEALTKEKRALPGGLKIVEVITPRAKDPVKEGRVDVYFFSNGTSDGATLHFEDDEQVKYSLKLHPITGQSKVEMGWPEEKR
jgi:prepilin-type N-terminal cleavage/methylation domain-containing protein